jgi:hypothetical protein
MLKGRKRTWSTSKTKLSTEQEGGLSLAKWLNFAFAKVRKPLKTVKVKKKHVYVVLMGLPKYQTSVYCA